MKSKLVIGLLALMIGFFGSPQVQALDQSFSLNSLESVSKIESNNYHSCAISSLGALCWGRSNFGQVGAGIGNFSTPTIIAPELNIVDFALGYEHTCALAKQNKSSSVWCWGHNNYGQLGLGGTPSGSVEQITVPTLVNLKNVIDISAGSNFTCALANSGKVFCWGTQLWTNRKVSKTIPAWVKHKPTQVKNLKDVAKITTGGNSACALSNSGEVYCWGENILGQLGNSKKEFYAATTKVDIPKAKSVALSIGHGCALLRSGKVSCWGVNSGGEVGTDSYFEVNLWNVEKPRVVVGLTSVKSVFVGNGNTCAIIQSGKVKCFGWSGGIGLFGEEFEVLGKVPVPTLSFGGQKGSQVSFGDNFACLLLQSKQLECLGNPRINYFGQLGNGEISPM